MLPRRTFVVIVLSAAIAASAVACSKATASSFPAATVGSTQITDSQLAKQAESFAFLASLNQQKCGTIQGNETQEASCNRFTLGYLIRFAMDAQYASQHKLTVADSILQKSLQGIDTKFGASAVNADLASNHLTRDDLTPLVREFLLDQAVILDLAKAQVTETQLHQMYQQQIAQFTTIDVEHILVKTKAEAQHAYKTVTAPGANEKTFLALAKSISIDPSAKQNSGHLGPHPASGYVAPFATAALALQPGQISKPVQSQYGWHVIRMVSKKVTPYSQVATQLVQSRSASVFQAWLGSQAAALKITVDPKFGRFNITSMTVDRISSTDTGATAAPGSTLPASP